MKIRFNIIVILTIIGLMAFFIPLITRSYSKLERLEREKQYLLLEEKKIGKNMEELSKSLEEIEDNYYIEKFAREKLKMKKQDETIYRVRN